MQSPSRLPKIHVSATFLFTIVLHLWFGLSDWLKDLLFSALLHECGHALALWYYGVPIRSIHVTSLGAVLSIGGISYRTELVCAAAGPAVNAALAVMLHRPAPQFALCNLGLFVFNLLPLYPLDGGRVLRALLSRIDDPTRAEIAECRIAIAAAGLIMLTSFLVGYFVTHNTFPPLIAASVLLRPLAAERLLQRT